MLDTQLKRMIIVIVENTKVSNQKIEMCPFIRTDINIGLPSGFELWWEMLGGALDQGQ